MGSFDEIIVQDEKERLFTAYATVEIKDKQKQFVPLSNFKKAFYKFMSRGASLNWMHTNRVIGKVINGEEEMLGDYKAFKITGLIYGHDDDIKDYDDAWEAIKSGKATGVSIGGGQPLLITKTDAMGDNTQELVTVPLLEISVVDRPANPLALITGFSMAKNDTEKCNEIKKVDFERSELLEGLKVELEHLDTVNGNLETVVNIALDHLSEDPNYYSKLKTIENPEVKKMDESQKAPSEQIDLAKSLQMMSESMAKMNDMLSKVIAKMESEKPAEPPKEVADEAKEKGESPVEEAKEEAQEEEKKPDVTEPDKEVEKSEPSDAPKEEVKTEAYEKQEGEDLSKADNAKVEALTKEVEDLKKQLQSNIKTSVTPMPQAQSDGRPQASSLWEAMVKEKNGNY